MGLSFHAIFAAQWAAAVSAPMRLLRPPDGHLDTESWSTVQMSERRRVQSGIPRQVFATSPNPDAIRGLRSNLAEVAGFRPEQLDSVDHDGLHDANFQHASWRVRLRLGWHPTAWVHVFNDSETVASAAAISGELEQAGLNGAYRAFMMLRPGAFKSDLWRYMKLWSEGGLYVDDSTRFTKPVDSWLDFDHDRLVLVQDIFDKSYWNALMAAEPKLPALYRAVAEIVRHVDGRFYGTSALEVTGPMVLYEQAWNTTNPPDIQTKLKLAMAGGVEKCGGYPLPPCDVHVLDLKSGEVVAYKDNMTHGALHSKAHYSNLWKLRQVYCDEPSDTPC